MVDCDTAGLSPKRISSPARLGFLSLRSRQRPIFCEDGRAVPPSDCIAVDGEPAGTRTQDPVIKSHVLYRLSYRLVRALHTEKRLP